MKKLISCALSISMLCSAAVGITAKAETPAVTPAYEITASDTADLNNKTQAASDSTMYVNYYKGATNETSYGCVKFDLSGRDLSKIVSAKLAVYSQSIEKDRAGDIVISDIGTNWSNTSSISDTQYNPTAEIKRINASTSKTFPVGKYSAIDITDYLRTHGGGEIGIGIASGYASVVTLSGINSDNPPKLIIQPGKQIDLTYTCDGTPCADMEVTLEPVGETEYTTSKFTTDENGKLTAYLTEGTYRATTERVIGVYNESSYEFTVSDSDLNESYTIEKNDEEKPENPTYTFGSSYKLIKEFNTASLSETKIGNTGLKVSTSGSNYNNVAIMDSSTKSGAGYYPLYTTLPVGGYYLYFGAGSGSDVSATLKFDNPIKAGKYITITYAKPTSTNGNNANRSAGNANTMTIGSETIDVEALCEFDKWYTTTIKTTEDVSQIDISLGAWSATSISKIEVSDSADVIELTAEDNIMKKYIQPDNQTIQYTARVYDRITTLKKNGEIVEKEKAVDTAEINYSVNGYNGVSIDTNGLLTVTGVAAAGTVNITAEYNGCTKSISLLLEDKNGYVNNLQTEYMQNPMLIDSDEPVFGWNINLDERAVTQTAYQIIMSKSKEKIEAGEGDVWDSGKVESSNSINAPYGGQALESKTRYYWAVRVWDNKGGSSCYSAPAYFETGLKDDEWQAQWITYDASYSLTDGLPVFGTNFTTDTSKTVQSARAYASGLGMFEMNINGQRTTDDVFEPGESNFDKKAFYVNYDITDKIKSGENAVGVYIGQGFYYNSETTSNHRNRNPRVWGPLMFIAQIEVTYTDGTKDIFCTDTSWKCAPGPVKESVWLGGEDYDARNEIPNFATTDWDISSWKNCSTADAADCPEKLAAKNYNSVKPIEEVEVVNFTKLGDGDYLVELEKNFAGIFTFTADVPKGTEVEFWLGENLRGGHIESRYGNIYDSYIGNGKTGQSYTPKFVYHGFKYIEIKGLDNVSADMIKGYVVHCDNEDVGTLNTSFDGVNKMHQMIKNSICDNMYNVFTDCPHREKLGWLEEAQLMYKSVAYNYDIASFSRKISTDMMDSQKSNGSVPSIVPPYTVGAGVHALRNNSGDDTPNDPTWCGSSILVPWYSYQLYGDAIQLEKAYPSMKKYMEYLTSLVKKSSTEFILESGDLNRDLGDWVAIDKSDVSFVVTATYYKLADAMASIADTLGESADSKTYAQLAENIKSAFNEKWFNYETSSYNNGTQAENAIPLDYGIVPNGYEKKVAENIAKKVTDNDNHLSTGEVGLSSLFMSLSEYGYADLAYKMMMNETQPSYYYFVQQNRTTLPEEWDGSASQNHFMLGHGEEWLFKYLGGIRNDGAAYNKSIIAPFLQEDINYADVSVNTRYGRLASKWERDGKGGINAEVTVPGNTTSKITFPANSGAVVTESGNSLDNAEGILNVTRARNEITVEVGSGTYSFAVSDISKTPGEEPTEYLITFVNYDNTELQSNNVTVGTMPSYNGATPTKPEDGIYTYEFAGWSPEITEVSGTATYKAEFKQYMKPASGFTDKVKIERTGNNLIITPRNDYELQPLTLYTAIYNSDKTLKTVTLTPCAVNEDGSVFVSLTEPRTGDGESYKLMLWDANHAPVIDAISGGTEFFK